MSSIRPFRGYRPELSSACRVASVPYDVVNTEEARKLAEGNPLSFLHVSRPEIDLPDSTDIHDPAVYAKGAENLARILRSDFTKDPAPCIYLYRQTMGGRSQTGLVALCPVSEYENGLIKKHEHTRSDKEEDRVRHVAAQNANAEPVFLACRADPRIDRVVARVCKNPPVYDFIAPDGVGHALWVINDEKTIRELQAMFRDVPALYVADGHHRTAAAARVGREKLDSSGGGDGSPYAWFMAVIFPHDQLAIMDYNRVVRDLNGLSVGQFLAAAGEKFDISKAGSPKPPGPHAFCMYLDGGWRLLAAKQGTWPAGDPIRSLDVSILQDNLLGPILGIADPRTDKRIDFIGGIRGTDELEKRVDIDGWAVAFSLYPTTIEQVMKVADAGKVMPPKSTWFEPKLRSGLVVRLYED